MTKFIDAKTLLNKYKPMLTKKYKDEQLIIDTIAMLERKIYETMNPYILIDIDMYGVFDDDKKTENAYRYNKYTRNIRKKLISLGYKFVEDCETYSPIEANYVLYFGIKK